MKIISYNIALLVLIILLANELTKQREASMSMPAMVSVSALLIGYVFALSLVGQWRASDERELQHRYFANRVALVTGTAVISVGILYQIFTHQPDWWLLASLIAINVVKIASLVYFQYKK